MITSLVRMMSYEQILQLHPGTKVVLRNRDSLNENYPLRKYKVGDIFVIDSVYTHDTLVYPALVLKGITNPHETIGGGFCSSRFGLWKNPKIYNVGGNL